MTVQWVSSIQHGDLPQQVIITNYILVGTSSWAMFNTPKKLIGYTVASKRDVVDHHPSPSIVCKTVNKFVRKKVGKCWCQPIYRFFWNLDPLDPPTQLWLLKDGRKAWFPREQLRHCKAEAREPGAGQAKIACSRPKELLQYMLYILRV